MISFTNVTKLYKNNFGIIDVTFEVPNNNIILFMGENGSGKSTCLKLISKSIFLTKKDQGTIINNYKKIAYLSEKFSLPSLISVKEYLKIYSKLYGLNMDYLDMLQKYHIPNKLICNLSKGMLQKLGLVLTIITPGDLFVFDEPTDGLDKTSRTFFQEDIKNLYEQGKTIIISTHNKNYFKGLKPLILTFQGGRVCKNKRSVKTDD